MHKAAYYVSNKVSTTQIIDARPPARFNGEVDEPRAGLRRGHIPGSKNVKIDIYILGIFQRTCNKGRNFEIR